MNQVRAKFQCHSIIETGHQQVAAHFSAVYSRDGENADFVKLTPAGNLSIVIDKDAPAATFFEQGKDYYLDFTLAGGK